MLNDIENVLREIKQNGRQIFLEKERDAGENIGTGIQSSLANNEINWIRLKHIVPKTHNCHNKNEQLCISVLNGIYIQHLRTE